MANIINGKTLSQTIIENIKDKVEKLSIKPSITVILVGNNPASTLYVNKKKQQAQYVGMNSEIIHLEETVSQTELENIIENLNNNKDTNAILVQLPLPKHINTDRIIEKIDPKKDVDGFHPINVGKLVTGTAPYALPCTPAGIIRLLEEYKIQIAGKHAVVIGRSNIVGKPIHNLLLACDATVTSCHSKTKDIKEITKQADILVSAVGIPGLVKDDWVKEGVVVIDVGINKTEEGKLSGDVDFKSVEPKASFITPVPGGVGPMTIAMLLSNTLDLYHIQRG